AMPVLLFFGTLVFYQTRQAHAPSPSVVTPDPATAASFGPMIERMLPCSAPCRMQYIQFHTGSVIAIGDGPGDVSDHADEYRRAEETGGREAPFIGGAEG